MHFNPLWLQRLERLIYCVIVDCLQFQHILCCRYRLLKITGGKLDAVNRKTDTTIAKTKLQIGQHQPSKKQGVITHVDIWTIRFIYFVVLLFCRFIYDNICGSHHHFSLFNVLFGLKYPTSIF